MDITGDFSSNFWAGVGIAAAVATALATGIATLLSAWWRWRDRAEADWAISRVEGGVYCKHAELAPRASVSFRLTNVGDGVAFKITAKGHGLEDEPLVNVPTDSRLPAGWTPASPSLRTDESLMVHAKCDDPTAWGSAFITIGWWHAPTRRKRRWFGIRSAQLREKHYLRDLVPELGPRLKEWQPTESDQRRVENAVARKDRAASNAVT